MRYFVPLLGVLMVGCVVSSEREGLPTGVTLLDSDQGYCDGPIEVEGNPAVVVEDGESTTVAVEDGDIAWECVAGDTADEHELDCPDGTDYLRISRDEGESEFRLECFG